MSRSGLLVLCLLVLASIGLHGLFVIRGLGEQDAGRLINQAASWQKMGVFPDPDAYTRRVSPGYLHLLRAAIDWGLPVADLPALMNWANVIVGSLALIPMFLLWRDLVGQSAAAAATLLYAATPTFWLANIYGMPHLPALALFLLSLLLFTRALRRTGWRYLLRIAAASVCMVVACIMKADIVMCSGALLGILLLERRCGLRNLLAAAALPIVGVALTLVYAKLAIPTAASTAQSAVGWSKRFPFDARALYDVQQMGIMVFSVGPVFFAALAASAVFCAVRKKHRRVLLLAALWALPPMLFWGLKLGNSARHMTAAYCGAFVLIGVASSVFGKARSRAAAVALLGVLNYFCFVPKSSTVIPSPRLFESAVLLQEKVEHLHAKGREFAEFDADKKLLLGGWSNAYPMFEVIANAKDFKVVGGSGYQYLEVVTRDGRVQKVRAEYTTLKASQVPVKDGWRTWSIE